MAEKLRIMLNPSNQFSNIGTDGISEAARMRAFALKIKSSIMGSKYCTSFDVVITGEDKTDSLKLVSNQADVFKPNLLAALHSNAGMPQATGVECFYYAGDNFTKNISIRLCERTALVLGISNRGAKTSVDAGGLYHVDTINWESILIETFFHSNANDVQKYKTNETALANEYAWIIIDSLSKQFGLPYPVLEVNPSVLQKAKVLKMIDDLKIEVSKLG
jgi:N-acetylmuramoyl-L-alanine amidase